MINVSQQTGFHKITMYLVIMVSNERLFANTVRHATNTAGSVVESKVVLHQPQIVIGQVSHYAVLGFSIVSKPDLLLAENLRLGLAKRVRVAHRSDHRCHNLMKIDHK